MSYLLIKRTETVDNGCKLTFEDTDDKEIITVKLTNEQGRNLKIGTEYNIDINEYQP